MPLTRKKLEKLRKRLTELRKSPRGIKPGTLVSIANALGRSRFARGNEPTYVSEADPSLRPLSIPNHRELKVGTACNIIEHLLDDIDHLIPLLPDDEE